MTKVGNALVDTENMSVEELREVINVLRKVNDRKIAMRNYRERMNELIMSARNDGFDFIDKTCGFVREVDDFTVYDGRA
jgi:hypothetical protein